MYVPSYSNGNCAIIYNDNVIRVYETSPSYNSDVDYVDYLLDHHYLQRIGTQHFTQYSTLPICSDDVTTNFYYRDDIFEIIIIFSIFIYINYFLISKLYKALFRGRALK